jgi:hypothetical protein
MDTLDKWMADSGADELAEWSHVYLAHAGGSDARKQIADLPVTIDKITKAIRALARVTEAISSWVLFAAGRRGSLMPVPQFNQLEKLDQPLMAARGVTEGYAFWDRLAAERDKYLDGVDVELLSRASA